MMSVTKTKNPTPPPPNSSAGVRCSQGTLHRLIDILPSKEKRPILRVICGREMRHLHPHPPFSHEVLSLRLLLFFFFICLIGLQGARMLRVFSSLYIVLFIDAYSTGQKAEEGKNCSVFEVRYYFVFHTHWRSLVDPLLLYLFILSEIEKRAWKVFLVNSPASVLFSFLLPYAYCSLD